MFGRGGLVAGLLTVMWTGGTVLIASRLSDEYVGLVLLATTGIYAGLHPVVVLAGAAAVTTIMVILAVTIAVDKNEPTHQPGRWTRVALASAIGLGIGALLVVDQHIDWSLGAIPPSGLLPSTVASFWGGSYLWRFRRSSRIRSQGSRSRGEQCAARPASRSFSWSAPSRAWSSSRPRCRCCSSWGARLFGVEMSGASVLVGFGLVALATLLVSLLESVGRGVWALFALAIAVMAEGIVSSWDVPSCKGSG